MIYVHVLFPSGIKTGDLCWLLSSSDFDSREDRPYLSGMHDGERSPGRRNQPLEEMCHLPFLSPICLGWLPGPTGAAPAEVNEEETANEESIHGTESHFSLPHAVSASRAFGCLKICKGIAPDGLWFLVGSGCLIWLEGEFFPKLHKFSIWKYCCPMLRKKTKTSKILTVITAVWLLPFLNLTEVKCWSF